MLYYYQEEYLENVVEVAWGQLIKYKPIKMLWGHQGSPKISYSNF